MAPLVRQQLGTERIETRKVVDQVRAIAVLEVGVDRQVHTGPDRRGPAHDGKNLIHVLAFDDRVEPDRHPACREIGNGSQDPGCEAGNAPPLVVALIKEVEGDGELGEARVPERLRARDGEHGPVRNHRHPGNRCGTPHFGDHRLEIGAK